MRNSTNADGTSGYLLMVEDEPAVQANNKKILERRGYNIRQAYSLAEARRIVAQQMPKAIVLDVQLPDGTGLEFLRELRQTSNTPVLMLTALGTPDDIVRGFEAGGDDYLAKPYDLQVFLVRIDALMRRAALVPDVIEVGPIRINLAASKAFYNGEDMLLQQREFLLLQQFMQHPEEILSAQSLYLKVWGQEIYKQDNSLRVAISKLRQKLENSGYTITSSRGEGYCFERK